MLAMIFFERRGPFLFCQPILSSFGSTDRNAKNAQERVGTNLSSVGDQTNCVCFLQWLRISDASQVPQPTCYWQLGNLTNQSPASNNLSNK